MLGMLVGLYVACMQDFKIGSVHAHLAIFGGAALIVLLSGLLSLFNVWRA